MVCKHGSHVTGIPNADWPGMKSKQLTATPGYFLVAHGKRTYYVDDADRCINAVIKSRHCAALNSGPGGSSLLFRPL